ncbi:hypothetical protein BU16DRAFT_10441 [Lophium mytilinum]|uniref:Myb-like domain-containing protein n=1 Tax=Lophium mytilinum TaxID=390894 RepID=A0A6A6RCA4_9PEZI|nr:hypothetical protein BU16DRAFT_10441 [Lophium mytilinum]
MLPYDQHDKDASVDEALSARGASLITTDDARGPRGSGGGIRGGLRGQNPGGNLARGASAHPPFGHDVRRPFVHQGRSSMGPAERAPLPPSRRPVFQQGPTQTRHEDNESDTDDMFQGEPSRFPLRSSTRQLIEPEADAKREGAQSLPVRRTTRGGSFGPVSNRENGGAQRPPPRFDPRDQRYPMRGQGEGQSQTTRYYHRAPIHKMESHEEGQSQAALYPPRGPRSGMPIHEDDTDGDRSPPALPPTRGQLLALGENEDKNALTRLGNRRHPRQDDSDEESEAEDVPPTKRSRGTESSLFFHHEEAQQTPKVPQQRGKLAVSTPNLNPENLSWQERLMNSLRMSSGFVPSPAGTRKNMVELDPENHWIKEMRVVHKMSWGEIKEIMNAQRAKDGKPQTFSEAAVYGRFVRNGPRIAEFKGEDFNVRDHMHIKPSERAAVLASSAHPQTTAKTPTANTKWNDEKRQKLIDFFEEANGEVWQIVADKMGHHFAETFDPAELEKLWGKFGKGGLLALSNLTQDTA